MTAHQTGVARACLEGAETGNLKFPQIVGQLVDAGFERYAVDFCRGTHTYYLPDGESVSFEAAHRAVSVGERFDVPTMRQAIREGRRVLLGHAEPDGTASRHTILPISLAGGFVRGHEPATQRLQSFALHRLTAVSILADDVDEDADPA